MQDLTAFRSIDLHECFDFTPVHRFESAQYATNTPVSSSCNASTNIMNSVENPHSSADSAQDNKVSFDNTDSKVTFSQSHMGDTCDQGAFSQSNTGESSSQSAFATSQGAFAQHPTDNVAGAPNYYFYTKNREVSVSRNFAIFWLVVRMCDHRLQCMHSCMQRMQYA